MSKYAMLALCVGVAACNNEYQDFEDPTPLQNPVAASFNKEFSAALESQGGLSKASQSGYWMYLSAGDEMSVFSGTANNKFVNTSNNVFLGNAADADKYYALFPYQEDATIADGVISARIAAEQTTDTATVGVYKWFNNNLLCVGVATDVEKSFALKNVGAAIQFYLATDKPVEKVEITATKNIAGDVKISIGDDGIPTVEGGDSKTITINNPLIKAYDNYVSTLPVGETDIEVKYYRDGKVAGTCKYEKVNLSRNALARFSRIDYHKATFTTGVEGVNVEPIKFYEGNGVSLPTLDGDVTNGNLTFAGWRAPNDTVYAAGSYVSIAAYEDINFTAEWVDGFVLKYDWGGMLPVVFKAGDEITLADLPDAPGYILKGWNVNGELKQPGDKIKPEGSLTVYAECEYKVFKVTIDANGGKFEDGGDKFVIEMRACDYLYFSEWNNGTYQFHLYKDWGLSNEWLGSHRPTRDGYIFNYYYVAGSENNSRDALGYPQNNTTFYAKWTKKCTIEYYNGNGDRMWKNDDNYFTENNTTFWLAAYYYSENGEDISGKILVGWKDQDGNVYDPGKSYPISVLSELKDLKLTPVFESTDNASSHSGWNVKPF